MRPAMTSLMASGPPLNGMCTALMPALSRKRSALRWDALPSPTDAKLTRWLSVGRRHQLARRLEALLGRDHQHEGIDPMGATATKSRSGS